MSEASPEEQASLAALGVQGRNLLGQEDVEDIGAALDPNSTAALMIWENVWAARFAESLRDADGILIANGRIPVAARRRPHGRVGLLTARASLAPQQIEPGRSHHR